MELDDLGEEVDEAAAVAVGANDVPTFIAARCDVPDGTRMFEAQGTSHELLRGSKNE